MDPAAPSPAPRPDSHRLSIPVAPPADSPQRSQTPSSALGLSPSKPSALPIGRLSRANSLVSSRPAPPSPASSRPPSQIFSPQLQGPGRARAGSGASSTTLGPTSTLGRRPSASGPSSSDPSRRASVSASRRKSALSNSVSAAASAPASGPQSASASASEEPPTPVGESLASTPIPELADDHLASPPLPAVQVDIRQPGEVIVRDYAYAPSDDRHRGIFPPVPDKRESRSSFNMGRWKFPFAPSPNPDSSGAGGGGAGDRRSGSGWGGFGLLGWRRRPSESSPNASSSGLASASGSGSGVAVNQIQTPDLGNDEDDYAFSSTASSSQDLARGEMSDDDDEEQEEEPYGTYRAMYQFVAEGQHEIDLEEGDVIHVRGWGVGEGWVVAVKTEGGTQRTGLVPEGFIERVNTPIEGDTEGHEHEGERTSTPTEMCSPGFKAEQGEAGADRSVSPAQL